MTGFKVFTASEITFCYLPAILLSYAPFKAIATKKQKRILFAAHLTLLLCNIIFLLMIQIFLDKNVVSSGWLTKLDYHIVGLTVIFINALVIKGYVKEHLFTYGIIANCHYLILSFSTYAAVMIPELRPGEIYLAGTVIDISLLMLSYMPIRIMLQKTVEPFLHMDSEEYWRRVWFIPYMMFCAMFYSVPLKENMINGYQLVSCVFISFTTIFLCYIVAEDRKTLMKKQTMEEMLSQSKLYYSGLQVKMEETKRARHDLKQIFVRVNHMVEADDKPGLVKLCRELEVRSLEKAEVPYTGNGAADSIIYHYMLKAQEEKIEFKYQGTIRSERVSDMDLCVLLGNALENAFYGCMTRKNKRKITVITQTEEQIVSIVVHNTFDGKIETKDNILLSRKRENDAGGIGLASMHEVCKRYGGTMEVKWDEDKFMVLFLLPV